MTDGDDREPTEAEHELANRRAFEAAYEVVRDIQIDSRLTRRAVIVASYRAMIAAQSAARVTNDEVDATGITASAWALHLNGAEDFVSEWSPESCASEVFLGFANACLLLKAHSDFQCATGDYSDETYMLDAYAQDALNALPDDKADDD
jgi:hypothetical protein